MKIETILEFFKSFELTAKISLVMTQLIIISYVIPQVINIAIKQNISQITIEIFVLFVVFGQIYYMFKMLDTFENLRIIFTKKRNKNPVGVA